MLTTRYWEFWVSKICTKCEKTFECPKPQEKKRTICFSCENWTPKGKRHGQLTYEYIDKEGSVTKKRFGDLERRTSKNKKSRKKNGKSKMG